jgi:hypothetical protein
MAKRCSSAQVNPLVLSLHRLVFCSPIVGQPPAHPSFRPAEMTQPSPCRRFFLHRTARATSSHTSLETLQVACTRRTRLITSRSCQARYGWYSMTGHRAADTGGLCGAERHATCLAQSQARTLCVRCGDGWGRAAGLKQSEVQVKVQVCCACGSSGDQIRRAAVGTERLHAAGAQASPCLRLRRESRAQRRDLEGRGRADAVGERGGGRLCRFSSPGSRSHPELCPRIRTGRSAAQLHSAGDGRTGTATPRGGLQQDGGADSGLQRGAG